MKITLPENIGEITLKQYQAYHKLNQKEGVSETEYNKRKVSIFTDIKYNDVDKVSGKDIQEIIKQIDLALSQEAEFQTFFKIKGIEFGMTPNLDQESFKVLTDSQLYKLDDIENYDRLMAILYRPVTKKDAFGNYEVEKYNGTDKYYLFMQELPMNIVNGVIVFFCNLLNELNQHSQEYLKEVELMRGKML